MQRNDRLGQRPGWVVLQAEGAGHLRVFRVSVSRVGVASPELDNAALHCRHDSGTKTSFWAAPKALDSPKAALAQRMHASDESAATIAATLCEPCRGLPSARRPR